MITSRTLLLLTNILLGFVEFIIGLRVFLKLFGARAAAPFVSWVYETSQPLLVPFEGMFPTSRLGGRLTLEVSALFALLVYAFLGYLVEELISYLDQSSHRHSKTS